MIAGFPNKENTILPLFWSPDGSQAALIQQDSLYRYTPEDGAWKELGQFPILREEVVWSPDGKTLIFVVQLENSKQDIFTIQADGKNVQNLTGNQFEENATIWVDGFLADGRLLFEVIRKDATQAYTMRLGDAAESAAEPAAEPAAKPSAKPAADFSMTHGILSISPDRNQIAYSTEQNGSTTVQVADVNLGGATSGDVRSGDPHQMASFRQSAVQQILWTKEENGNAWVIFLVSSGSSEETVINTVFAVRPDGSDLRQLFQDRGIQRLVAPAGGKFLIAEGTENGRLTVLPIDGGKIRLVEAPGLRLDQRLLGASWR
jgi:Tol biopolymer transport system component